jgi:putative protease
MANFTEEETSSLEEGKLIGRVTHYFSKIGVAVIELSDTLKVGDTIRIVGGTTDFTQKVESMEIEHKKVEEAKKGDSVGLEVSQKVREGYKVYKI